MRSTARPAGSRLPDQPDRTREPRRGGRRRAHLGGVRCELSSGLLTSRKERVLAEGIPEQSRLAGLELGQRRSEVSWLGGWAGGSRSDTGPGRAEGPAATFQIVSANPEYRRRP